MLFNFFFFFNGNPILFNAFIENKLDYFNYLIEKGANINSLNLVFLFNFFTNSKQV